MKLTLIGLLLYVLFFIHLAIIYQVFTVRIKTANIYCELTVFQALL